MSQCPICNSINSENINICECGYNFSQEEIVDPNKIQAFMANLSTRKRWQDEVRAKRTIHEVQKQRYPAIRYGKYGGWSYEKTASLLGESKGLTKPDIELAEAFDQNPELSSLRNKTKAKNRLKTIKNCYTIMGKTPNFEFEDELQNHLFKKWDETEFHDEWKLQETGILRQGKYNTQEVGEIDILEKHCKDNRWLVIELKKSQSSDETVGQILRYMGWVKENLAAEDGKVEGIIISNTADDRIRYALVCVPDI